ncbi:hypothetical protein SDC9_116161 [bioreactor metagenome]|uniref:Uncharacterized protein n=1 Tax=bioreactor metagenome TaxID=1076179 RepID=A0A645BVI0_9ZZZZ
MGAQGGVLGFHHTGQGAHQNAAFAGQIAVHLVLEGGWEEIARAYCNTEGQGAFCSAAGGILKDGKAAVDAAAIQKVGAYTGA